MSERPIPDEVRKAAESMGSGLAEGTPAVKRTPRADSAPRGLVDDVEVPKYALPRKVIAHGEERYMQTRVVGRSAEKTPMVDLEQEGTKPKGDGGEAAERRLETKKVGGGSK